MTTKRRTIKTSEIVPEQQKKATKVLANDKIKPIKDRQTRVEILQHISDQTKLKRVEVESVFSEMAKLIRAHLKKQGSGEIMIPKLGLKIRKVRRKSTKKRTMVSPLTGQEVVIAPKPSRDDVKLIALKPLKAAVLS
ncbi:MAG TPA: HU family DNA-binding protein [Gammaproteobacteria bacterium]|nr:HU family DNA-binding protein [Gammaproteobacteria bacterium]